jgi:small subunit ribosomal protein S6e
LAVYKKLAHDVHEAKKRHRKASSEIKEKVVAPTK